MPQQISVDPAAEVGDEQDDTTREILPDLAYKRLGIVNVVFVGQPGRPWVLIDAGLPGTATLIRRAAARRFGEDAKPAAIVMTHGHFDHVGALETLLDEWDVPVFAHAAEAPFLDGREAYPPPDRSVGGGLMARMAPLFPRGPVDVSRHLRILPQDGSIPPMPGWRWLHTPGHAPGHVSFWREADRSLIVGDAFVTTAPESVYASATQEAELHGPPKYFTPDWTEAAASVRTLAALKPERVVTGHGVAMEGPAMQCALQELADRFEEVAVPSRGRYVPATAPGGPTDFRAP